MIDAIIEGKDVSTTTRYKPPSSSASQLQLRCNKAPEKFLGKHKSKKIAPVQNVNSIQMAKARIVNMTIQNTLSTSKTPIQTVSKGNKRTAHIPDMSLEGIPDVLQAENRKISVNIRTRYLTMIADECVKLYLIKEDGYDRALKEELKASIFYYKD